MLAHHSARFNHDTATLVPIRGTIEKVELINLLVWIWLNIKRDNGQGETQRIEIAGPGLLIRNGLTKEVLKYGDEVSIEAWPSVNGKSLPAGKLLTLADGRQFDVADRWSE
jgi:hypothetical protein